MDKSVVNFHDSSESIQSTIPLGPPQCRHFVVDNYLVLTTKLPMRGLC